MMHGPAFQFYPNDWLGSSTIALMSPGEEGAYIRLLCHSWNDPGGTLPDDDKALAVLSRLGDEWFKGSAIKLRACFIPHPRKVGRLFNVRLLEERKKQAAWRRKSRQGGIQSGKTRALQAEAQGRVVEGSLKGGSSKHEPKGNSSSSLSFSLSSSSSSKEKKENTCALNGHSGQPWSEGFKRFWAAYPKRRNKGHAEQWFATHRPAPDLIETMLAKIAELKTSSAWQDKNGDYVPHPLKWLDAKGWEDEARVDVPPIPRRATN